MGLDMYLRQSEYYSGYEFARSMAERQKEVSTFDKLSECVRATPTKESPSIVTTTTVAYWRKANAIHAWFVDTLADGVDECQQIQVTREDLQNLSNLCKETLQKMKDKPGTIPEGPLQPRAGFFFGDTESAEYFKDDLENTVNQLDTIIKDTAPPEGGYSAFEEPEFIYQASW